VVTTARVAIDLLATNGTTTAAAQIPERAVVIVAIPIAETMATAPT